MLNEIKKRSQAIMGRKEVKPRITMTALNISPGHFRPSYWEGIPCVFLIVRCFILEKDSEVPNQLNFFQKNLV